MPCTNPSLKAGTLCDPARATFKKICKRRCKWYVAPVADGDPGREKGSEHGKA